MIIHHLYFKIRATWINCSLMKKNVKVMKQQAWINSKAANNFWKAVEHFTYE